MDGQRPATGELDQGLAHLRAGEHLRLALDVAGLGTWTWDLRTGQGELDARTAQIVGLPDGVVDIAAAQAKVIHPDDLERVRSEVAAAVVSGHAFSTEYRVVHPDGSIHHVVARARVLYDEHGEPCKLVGTNRDVTAERRVEAALRESEARQTFLLRLNDRLRPLADPHEIQLEASRAIGEYLDVSRVGYGEDIGDGETLVVSGNYTNGMPSLEGRYRYDDYGGFIPDAFHAGRTVAYDDVRTDPRFTESQRGAHAEIGITAMIAVPLTKEGRLVAVLFLHDRIARHWTPDVIALVEAVAERTWDAVERARAEDALRRSEGRYRALFQSIDEGFCIIEMIRGGDGRTIDYRFVEVNDMFERQTGLHDVVGRTVRELLPDIESFWIETYDRVARTGESRRFSQHAQPLRRWFDVYAFRTGDPERGQVAVLFKDVTERKRADEALAVLEARQRMALEAAELGTWRYDIEHNRVELDARAQAHYGLDRQVLTLEDVLARIHPDHLQDLRQHIVEAFDPHIRRSVSTEYRVLHANGAVRWLAVIGQVHFDESEDPPRATIGIGTTRDVTEQKRAEQALRDADRRKDEFLAILAHELRNPLAPIRTAVGIMRAPNVPERMQQRARDIIERQAAQMARLVDDLLDVSRLSRGKMILQRAEVPLDQVLDLALETARPLIEERRHRLTEHRSTRPLALDGDLARLSQVFANLLNNAAKYTPPGGLIALVIHEADDRVNISVSDTGMGIDAEHLTGIFELFAQGTTPTSSVGGLGIGLALARRLVELHGGSLTVSSPGIGHGATFTVTLPIVQTVAEPRAAMSPVTIGCVGRRVLVVDDNIDAAESTAAFLSASGCEVRTAFSGEQALADAASFAPDLILLDLGMPGLDGLETCRRLRTHERGSRIAIVALTGWGQEDDRRRTRLAGFDAHLVKPVAPDALLHAVEDITSRS